MGRVASIARKFPAVAILAAALLATTECGGAGQTVPPPPPPPSTTLNTLVPNYAVAGTGSTSIFVDGSGFTNSSVVEWNGAPLPTTFGTSQILSTSISGSLLALPGAAAITVKDSSSGASSNSLPFGIASPAAATAGVVSIITVAADGTPANGDSLVAPSISATGRYVAFQSAATNLAPGPASGFEEIYERDTCIGALQGCTPNTIRVTVTYDGSVVNGHSRDSAISSDGRYVAFDSSATNILPNSGDCAPSTGIACIFLRDTCIGASSGRVPNTIPISVDVNGTIVRGGGTAITPDGRFVVFGSPAANVAMGDTSTIGDAFIRDTCNGVPSGCTPETSLVSASSTGAQRDAFSGPSAVGASGRYVAFQSYATNMVPNDTNGQPDVFVRDTCIGATGSCTPATTRVDVSTSGTQANTGVFPAVPAISGDGRIVAFAGQATNLVPINVNGWGNVYVHDTCAGALAGCTPATNLASLANDGSVGNAPSPSQGLAMTPDGRFIVFDSIATNLVPGDTFPAGGFEDVFVRDTCYGLASGCTPSTVRVSVTNMPNPETPGDSSSSLPAISADGHYVVFLSAATNLAPGVTGNGHAMVCIAKTGF